jgi:hypothetical protein
MTTLTLQDMPDDILELIYSNLSLYDSIQTNIALHKRIIKSKILRLDNIEIFHKIPHNYHPYIFINKEPALYIFEYFLKNTNIYGINMKRNVNYLSTFSNIKELIIKRHKGINLNMLTTLEELNCSESIVHEPLTLTNLKQLICLSSNITNISLLTKLTHLDCPITKICEVNDLVNLTYLNCYLTPISNVSNLINLIDLNCSDTNITNVNMLVNLRYLVCLNTKIKDVSKLVKLKYLNMNEYIDNVDTLTELKILSCSNNRSIKSIGNLPKLTRLYCNYTNISDISHLTNLEVLYCGSTKIIDVSALTKLKSIKFNDTIIKDLSQLNSLTNIQFERLNCVYYKDEDRWIVMMRKDISDIILPEHIKEKIKLQG